MNSTFLSDESGQTTFADFLKSVNETTRIKTPLAEKDLSAFDAAFCAAVARNVDIEIIDADTSQEELQTFGIAAERIFPAAPLEIKNWGELIETIKNSHSKISLFTSGTTGRPKRVVHTIASLARRIRVSPEHAHDVWGFAYNPAHMAGIQVFLQALFNANKTVNLFGRPAAEMADLIEKNAITHISATPTFYRMLLGSGGTFVSVKRATLGGERADACLCDALARLFPNAKINNVYASTEAGALFASDGETFSIPRDIADKVKFSDGEILLHKTLLGNSDSFALDADGYYHTGDLVEFTDAQQTRFKITARKSNMINTGGYKVNPSEVEDALREIEGVADAVVFGKKNSVLGSVVCAEVELRAGTTPDEPRLRKILASRLQAFKIPRIISFGTIKTTHTGKAKRQ